MKSRAPIAVAEDAARRVPTQERAKKRVERIIDAAAHVFAKDGYDAATMEAIAARAETSIGSIYQFFPNKLSVFNALTRHYHEKVRLFLDLLLAGPLLERPWGEILEASIDALSEFHEHDVGFRAVWVGLHLTEAVVSEGEAINREFAKRLELVLAAKLPKLPAEMRPVVSTMIVEILSAVLIVSARRPAEAKGLMTEAKAMLRRYLAPYEEENATPPPVRKESQRRRAAVRSAR